jgi:hypothetical protein
MMLLWVHGGTSQLILVVLHSNILIKNDLAMLLYVLLWVHFVTCLTD